MVLNGAVDEKEGEDAIRIGELEADKCADDEGNNREKVAHGDALN